MRIIDPEAIKVHVTNPEDIATEHTEEKEPEHFVFSTVTVAFNVPGYNNSENILALDLLRKDASILAVDNPVIVCHSAAQLQNPANQVVGVPYPQGAYLPAGSSLTVTGTGRAWVVATVASPSRISLFVNRRDR